MDLDSIELHDGTLDRLAVDYDKKSVILDITYYTDPVHAPERIPAQIVFSDVTQLNGISDFLALTKHRSAGNIVYWQPAKGAGTTYLHLINGLLAVTAHSVAFKAK